MTQEEWAWDLDEAYSPNGRRAEDELGQAAVAVASLEAHASQSAGAEWAELDDRAARLLGQLQYVAIAQLGIDAADDRARILSSKVDELIARRDLARKRAAGTDQRLVSALSEPGHQSWARLYRTLVGTLAVDLDGRTLGWAEAAQRLQSPDRSVRARAYEAIERALAPHRETLAAAIGAIHRWRRALEPGGDALAPVLVRDRMSKPALDALIEALTAHRSIGQRALAACGRALGIEQLAPWDLSAPPPAAKKLALSEGLLLATSALTAIDPELGAFVRRLSSDRRIDARSGPRRRPGAMALPFLLERTSRVHIQWSGTLADLRILGHELGHAIHYEHVKDAPAIEMEVPTPLLETPSAFTELAIAAELERSPDTTARRAASWQDLMFSTFMVLGMPARFTIERELAALDRPVSPTELDERTQKAFGGWYGATVEPADRLLWMRSHHFYSSEGGFAYLPYAFGYLLALIWHRRRERAPDQFYPRFALFLSELGRERVETLVERHLDADITRASFYDEGFEALESKIDRVEPLLSA